MKTFMRIAVFVAGAVVGAAALNAWQTKGTASAGKAADPVKRVHPVKLPHPTKEILQPTVLTKHELYSEDKTADTQAVEQVFSAYTFANDTHNGPLAASLFTDDAIVHFVYNEGGTSNLVPTFGINPKETPWGTKGEGCNLYGPKDIAQYFGFNRTANLRPQDKNGLPLPWPGHHMVTNKMTYVDDDLKNAMLTATWLTASTAPRPGGGAEGSRPFGTGMYRIFFRKGSDGWRISEFYGVSERPSATTQCDLNGPLPRAPK